VGKKLLIIISLIVFIYTITSLLSEKEVVISESINNEEIQVINKIDTDNTEIENNVSTNKNQPLNKLKDLSHYNYFEVFNNCGFSQEIYDKRNEAINIKELKDEQLDKFDEEIQDCNKWFAELQNLPLERLKQLKLKFEKKKKLLTRLIKYKYDKNTLGLSRRQVSSDDFDIKSASLAYLLKFDFDFQKQIAQEMNVSQINYLTTDGITLNILYLCHHGYDCSSQSQIMQDTCRRDENSCGMSFPTWLRSGQVSLNLYDDMMRAIIAIDKVLDSDWFLEHQLDS